MPFRVFLSHSSTDKPAVEELARRLAKEGIQTWLDKWHLIPGNPWQPDIEKALAESETCAVFVGPNGFGPWQNEEMRAAIDQRVRDSGRRFRVIPVLLPGAERGERSSLPTFLAATTWVEFRDSLEDPAAFHRLVCGIRGLEPGTGPGQAIYEGQCPYRGLRVFDLDDAPFFFGREALVQWLLNELRPAVEGQQVNRFLAIVGSSGSGKSSLARAGLVAALKHDAIPGSARWLIAICRPGPDPLESLAVALSRAANVGQGAPALAELIGEFQKNDKTLHLIARQSLPEYAPDMRLVVVVDQFEEVFTHCRKEGLREALIRNLLYAAKVAQGQTLVILTMRADFYGKCAANAELAAAFSDHHVLVGTMTEEELRRAIERPTQLVGCELETGLVDLLVQDVRRQPGALPLLQHALLELWSKREGRRLTVKAYQEIGTLEGALQRRADATLKAFSQHEQELCRRTFLRLTQPGEGTEDTKRRASIQELLSLSGKSTAEEDIIQKLADASLLTTEGDLTHKDAFVEVAHEALIRNWPQLRKWIDADRAGLRTRTRLSESARDWKNSGRDPTYLYSGARLAVAEEWAASHPGELSTEEADFLRCGLKQRNQRKRQRWYSIGLRLLGLSVVVGIGWIYFDLEARKKRALESSQKYVQRAQEISRLDDPIKDVLALRDLSTALHDNIGNTDAAKLACQLLYSTDWCLALTPDLRYQTDSSYSILCAATFSPSHMGDKVFAVAKNGDLVSWTRGDRELHSVQRLFTNEDPQKKDIPLTPTAAFFSDGGESLLVISPAAATYVQPAQPRSESSTGANSAGGVVKAELWRWSSPSDSYDLIQKDITLSGLNSYRVVSWAANGTEFIVISFSQDWNESFCQIFQSQDSTFKEIKDAPFQPPEKKVMSACFDYHNRWIATVSREGFVELWDPKNFSPAIETSGGKVSFSPPSKFRPSLVASGSGKDELTITAFGQPGWILDVGNGRFRELPPLPTPRDQFEVFTFGPEHGNRRLSQAVLYRRAVVQNESSAARIEPICFSGVFGTAQFSYDGKQLLTLSGDTRNALDTIRIWRVPSFDLNRRSTNVEFTGKDAPAWLADLASVASGAPQLSDNDPDVSSIVDKLSKEGPGSVAEEYKEVWYRFFPEMPEK